MNEKNHLHIYYRRIPMKIEKNHKHFGQVLHTIGRDLLFFAWEQETGEKITEESLSFETKGKPYVAGGKLFFNISHCPKMVFCALSDVPVGIDAESRRDIKEALLKKVCDFKEPLSRAEQEERFFRTWTRLEAYGKLTGEGISFHKILNKEGVLSEEETESAFYYTEDFSEDQVYVSVFTGKPCESVVWSEVRCF